MDNGDLTLHFQPVIALTSGEIIGAEALLRWPDPRRGIDSPARVHPDCRGNRPDASDRPMDIARGLSRGRDVGLQGGPFFVGVNVSAGQLRDGNLVDEVAAALVESKFDPGHLVLELTESLLLPDDAITMSQLDQLKDSGSSSDRRLRSRLFVAQLPAEVSLGRAEDRPVSHLRCRSRPESVRAGSGGHPPGPFHGAEGSGRGYRETGRSRRTT